jgi:hypothetical protein
VQALIAAPVTLLLHLIHIMHLHCNGSQTSASGQNRSELAATAKSGVLAALQHVYRHCEEEDRAAVASMHCAVCAVDAGSKDKMTEHLASQKHAAKAQAAGGPGIVAQAWSLSNNICGASMLLLVLVATAGISRNCLWH